MCLVNSAVSYNGIEMNGADITANGGGGGRHFVAYDDNLLLKQKKKKTVDTH